MKKMQITLILVILGIAILITLLHRRSVLERSAPPIRIENGRFISRETGEIFAARGFNYVRLARGHSTFKPSVYDRERAVKFFRHMEENNFNAVRVFIFGLFDNRRSIHGAGAAATPEDEAQYLDNLAEFLLLAKDHGILVVPCIESLPRTKHYRKRLQKDLHNISEKNNECLNQSYIDAKCRYIRDIIRGLRKRDPAALSAVLSWELQNECCFWIEPPFSLDKGTVTPANGVTYDLATDKETLADDMAVYWIDQLAAAIRREIPDALVSADMFTYHAVRRKGPGDFSVGAAGWLNRYPFNPTALLRSSVDIIDIHVYATDGKSFLANMESIEHEKFMQSIKQHGNKAVMVGEFGVFKEVFTEINDAAAWMPKFIDLINDQLNAAGWMYWTYDTDEQERLWNAMHEDGRIFDAIK